MSQRVVARLTGTNETDFRASDSEVAHAVHVQQILMNHAYLTVWLRNTSS